jgi:RND family efflux transporter MFP subunit
MKRFSWSVFSAIVILVISANPAFAPHVSFRCSVTCGVAASENNVSAQKTVTASAVVVPAQVSEMGFLISGIAKDIPVEEGDAVQAGETLLVLDTPDLQYGVTEAEAGVRVAQAQADIRSNELIKKYLIYYTPFSVKVRKAKFSAPHEVIDMANFGVEQAQAVVEGAQAKLAQGTLTAPFDGTVTSLGVIPGEFVKANQSVVTLATLDDLQLETTDLSERDIPNVQIGDPVNIFIEALNKNISGKVISISPKADIVGGDVVYKVTIAPDTQLEGLLWGMTADVEIQSGK